MKKMICLLLVLFLLPSVSVSESSASSDYHPDEIVGCWAVFIPNASTYGAGDHSIVISFNSDGSMSSMISINSPSDHTVSVSTLTGKWILNDSRIIYQRDGSETINALDYADGMVWVKMDSMSFGLKKIPDIEVSQLKYVGE